jgi:hypothetical protein
MDASAHALAQGIRSTRTALVGWRRRPWPILRAWLGGSFAVAVVLLVAVWSIASLSAAGGGVVLDQPPFVVGGPLAVLAVLGRNLLVLALHAMACVAGFIAGSSLPSQAQRRTGLSRAIHERGCPVAIALVVCATGASLTLQADVLGRSAAAVAATLRTSPALLLISLLPHALPELVALFLPLAAWIAASRRGAWSELLAATVVTVALAVPMLLMAAVWEVYVAPHVVRAMIGHAAGADSLLTGEAGRAAAICFPSPAHPPARWSPAEVEHLVAGVGIRPLAGAGRLDIEGPQDPMSAWSDQYPSDASPRDPFLVPALAGYEVRWWSPVGVHEGADLFVFATAADAARYVRRATSTRCRHAGAISHPVSAPTGAVSLVWDNPLGDLQGDVFFARGRRVYRVSSVPPGPADQRPRDVDVARLLETPEQIACELTDAACRAGT